MTDAAFDPQKFIDREAEQELFEDLLLFKDDARILAIKDGPGCGKSELLKRFQYRCRTVKPRIAVSRIELDQLAEKHPLGLVEFAIKQLEQPFNIPFARFKTIDLARKGGDFAAIRNSPIWSTVDLSKANFQGATNVTVGGTIIQRSDITTVLPSTTTTMTADQEKDARELCVRAFLDDLQEYCTQNPVVLLLDAYDKCDSEELKNWITGHFLERYFFDLSNRPQKLVLVMAGRDIPHFESHWSPEDCRTVVRSRDKLGIWEKRHIEAFLRVHGYQYSEDDVNSFYNFIQKGLTPKMAVLVIETMKQQA